VDFDGKKEGTSAILTNLLGSSALLIQDENSTDIKAGDLVNILLLDNIK
jgi:molybdopterin molybdotransferase